MLIDCGERPEEIIELMKELYSHGVRYITLGQYLKPAEMPLPVIEYIEEDIYQYYREQGQEIGLWVQASPLTRSSYMADHLHESAL